MGCFDMGGEQETTTSQTTKNIYTKEQKQLLKDLIGGVTPVVPGLSTALQEQIQSAITGEPTEAYRAMRRTGLEDIASRFGTLATRGTEALAGRGRAGGVLERVMANLMTGEAKAGQDLETELREKQQEDLWRTISSALGLTQLGGQLAIASRGGTGTGTTVTTQPMDLSGLGYIVGSILSKRK